MLEKVYDTIRGILFYKMPKNNSNQVVIYDQVVTGWYFGDRDIKPSALSIIAHGSTQPVSDSAFGLQEIEHRITIGVDAGSQNTELSERKVLELARVVYNVLKDYRTLWVMELCPFCGKWAMSPKHFSDDHSTVMSPYLTTAQTNMTARWLETHDASSAQPSVPDSGLAAAAFTLLYEDVRNGNTVANLSTEAKENILAMQKDLVQPIRLLYGIKITEVQPSDDGRGQQLLRQGKFTMSAREFVKVVNVGPDDVPNEAV